MIRELDCLGFGVAPIDLLMEKIEITPTGASDAPADLPCVIALQEIGRYAAYMCIARIPRVENPEPLMEVNAGVFYYDMELVGDIVSAYDEPVQKAFNDYLEKREQRQQAAKKAKDRKE